MSETEKLEVLKLFISSDDAIKNLVLNYLKESEQLPESQESHVHTIP